MATNAELSFKIKADGSQFVKTFADVEKTISEVEDSAIKFGESFDQGSSSVKVAVGIIVGELNKARVATGKAKLSASELVKQLGAIGSTGAGFKKASEQADKLKQSATGAKNSVGGLAKELDKAGESSDGINRISGQLESLKRSASGIIIGAIGVDALKSVIELADQYANLNARIKLTTGSSAEFVALQRGIFEVAQSTASPLGEIANLYVKISDSIKNLGGNQATALKFTQAIAQAMQLGGASTAEMSSALQQLSQALASGVLRGDEFNSIMEASPRIAKALAAGLNEPIGNLRKLAEEGKLTTDKVVNALLSQSKALDSEFSKLPNTVGRSMQRVRNEFEKNLGQLDQSTGFTKTLSEGLNALAGNMQAVATVAEVVLAAALGKLVASSLASIQAWQAERLAHIEKLRLLEAEAAASLLAANAERARVAASLGTSGSLVAAQAAAAAAAQRHAAAQVALAGAVTLAGRAAGVLATGLRFLGGPVGLLFTAASLIFAFGDSAEKSADKVDTLTQETNDFGKALDKLNGKSIDVQLFTLGEQRIDIKKQISDIQAQQINALAAGSKQDLAGVIGGANSGAKLDELTSQLDQVNDRIKQLEASKSALEGPNEKALDKFTNFAKGFHSQTEQFADDIANLKKLAKEAGISETDPRFAKAADEIKQRYNTKQAAAGVKDFTEKQKLLTEAAKQSEDALNKEADVLAELAKLSRETKD